MKIETQKTKGKYSAYTKHRCLQLRDNEENILALMQTMGGGCYTNQQYEQAKKLLKRIVYLLNNSTAKTI